MSFVLLVLVCVLLVPALAALVRRGLPAARRERPAVDPMVFGPSQKSRRSPRHAVLLHRGLVGTLLMTLVALSLLPAAAAFEQAGLAMLPTLMAFVIPVLLVTLHARRRSLDE